MKTAIYMRVSTEEQQERGSIETQRIALDAWATNYNVGPVEVYADDGVTGTLALERRPEGLRLMQDVQAGKINRVVVYKVDRLGRSALAVLNAVEALEGQGVEFVSISDNVDTRTPAGRLFLTMLSGFAGFERETTLQRSADGTNRLAREGAWLGGIVPYGYRADGKKNLARIVVADDPMPGVGMSEADVIRMIFRMVGDEGQSTIAAAHTLNALHIPTRYTRDARQVARGKRMQATANYWTPSRVRNMLISTTYKGVHEYGKRSKKAREIITREVPAIVAPDQWQRAQDAMRRNLCFAKRNQRREYLLRGLMKCAHCGLTYIGTANKGAGGQERRYYKCNGKHSRGRNIPYSHSCPSKQIPANEIESAIWNDVEQFLRNPGDVLAKLDAQLSTDRDTVGELTKDAERLERAAAGKQGERDALLTLYRRGRIDDASLDRQLDQIDAEESALRVQIDAARSRIAGVGAEAANLASVETLLRSLHKRLDGPLDTATRRDLVELLVDRITVHTGADRTVSVAAHYRFTAVGACTGTDSSRQPA